MTSAASTPIPSEPAGKTASEYEWQAWKLVAGLSIISLLLIGGMMVSLSVYLPILQRHFSWTDAQLGLGPTVLLVSMGLSSLLAGPAMPRMGLRPLLLTGVGSAVIGWCAAGAANTLAQFALAMAATGFGIGAATIVPGISTLTRRFEQRRGLAIAWFLGSSAVASAIAPAVSAVMIAAFGWRSTFLAVGATTGMLCALVQRWASDDGTKGGDPATPARSQGTASPSSPRFWLLALALLISQFAMNGVLFSLEVMLESSGFRRAEAVSIYSVANLMAIPGLFLGGRLADRHGARLVLPLALLLQTAGTLCLLPLLLASSVTGQWLSALAFVILWGPSGGLPGQIGPMRLAELARPASFTTLLSITFTIQALFGALAPLSVGVLVERYHSYIASISLLSLFASLAAGACFLLALERQRRVCT